MTLIEHLRLSPRVYNALVKKGIDTVEQLRTFDTAIRLLRGIGIKGQAEIENALKNFPSQS